MHPVATASFLLLAAAFAAVHLLAVAAALYWYHWWFDILMHLWGGVLITFAVLLVYRHERIRQKPRLSIVVAMLLGAAISWEVFERLIGLYDPAMYWRETSKDIACGLLGGLIGYALLRDATMS